MSEKYTALFVSDIHLGAKLYNIPELGDDHKRLFTAAVDLAIKKKVTYFVVAGDLYDTQSPSEELVKFVSDERLRLESNDVTPIGISGDHDKRPGVSTTWIEDINGFSPRSKHVLGLHYKNFLNVPETLESIDSDTVEWIVLHGQEETVFPFVEEKKRLNLHSVNVSDFPNLRGFILGDIHKPLSSVLSYPEHNKNVAVIYCGSLGVIKSDEIGTKNGLLFWNGDKLERINFPSHRTYAKFNFPDDAYLLPRFITDIKNEKHKPLVVVSYADDLAKEHLDSLKQIEPLVFLRRTKHAKDNTEEVVNIRSELKTEDKIGAVADGIFKDEADIKLLFLDLLSSVDAKGVLDAYKIKMLETQTND